MVQLTDPDVQAAINMVWVLVAGIFCFFLQAGFGLLEVGSVRAKNAQNIMLYVLVPSFVFFGVCVCVCAPILSRCCCKCKCCCEYCHTPCLAYPLFVVSFAFAVSQTGSICDIICYLLIQEKSSRCCHHRDMLLGRRIRLCVW
jgi:Ammonium Transporter Family